MPTQVKDEVQETAHTPGEWYVDVRGGGYRIVAKSRLNSPSEHGRVGIANVIRSMETFPNGQDKANASLIAASPDLYEACQAMLDMYNAVCDKVDWGKSFLNAATIRKMNEAPILAEKALEKAKG